MKKIHRFLIEIEPKSEIFEINEKRIFSQIVKVLKKMVGEKIIVFADKGKDLLCEIIQIGKNSLMLKKTEIIDRVNEPEIELSAYIAITKGENFELVVQKLSELGVRRIVPIISERTIKQAVKSERLQKISDEALELSGGNTRVEIELPQKFEDSLKNISGTAIYFDLGGSSMNILNKDKLTMYIGPEGGWSDSEIESFKRHGIKAVTLGKRTLRAETAAIVATQKILWN